MERDQAANVQGIWTFDIFIKDCIDAEEMRTERYPSDEMIGGFYTKPLQGNFFQILQQNIEYLRWWCLNFYKSLQECLEYRRMYIGK